MLCTAIRACAGVIVATNGQLPAGSYSRSARKADKLVFCENNPVLALKSLANIRRSATIGYQYTRSHHATVQLSSSRLLGKQMAVAAIKRAPCKGAAAYGQAV